MTAEQAYAIIYYQEACTNNTVVFQLKVGQLSRNVLHNTIQHFQVTVGIFE